MCLAGCVGWVHDYVQNAPCPRDKLTNLFFELAHAWLPATSGVIPAQHEMLLSGLGHVKSCYC